jgi:hypothetical protein
MAASIASSYGQANYYFDTYLGIAAVGASPDAGQVEWTTTASLAPAGLAGTIVADNTFHADLLWSVALGDGAGTGDLGLSLPVGNWTGPNGAQNGLGYIQALNNNPELFDLNYDLITPIQFTIEAWEGGSWATATAKGSLTWTDPGVVPGTGSKSFALTSPIIVATVVPEPTTLALAGLGAAGLLMFRKRQ